jgi:hypothetical protein
MPFVDTDGLKVVERLPGSKARYSHSASMTFAHYDFAAGSTIHEHHRPEEEVYGVLEGEGGDHRRNISDCQTRRGCHRPRKPSSLCQSLSRRRLIVGDHPSRPDFG